MCVKIKLKEGSKLKFTKINSLFTCVLYKMCVKLHFNPTISYFFMFGPYFFLSFILVPNFFFYNLYLERGKLKKKIEVEN